MSARKVLVMQVAPMAMLAITNTRMRIIALVVPVGTPSPLRSVISRTALRKVVGL